jgi:osmoprotectant transport system permease protein
MLSEIITRTGEHLFLVIVAMSIAIIIGIPLGIIITKKPKLAPPILALANGIQTIPSLAIFGFLLSIPLIGGIGKIPVIIALTLYALLPLIRNTYIGITNLNPAIKEAGIAMGMTPWQLLTKVEIPLALPVIIAGIRVATVITVGIATIAAAIGGGGLGVFIFRGIATVNHQLILAGAIPATLMALLIDASLGFLAQRLTKIEVGNKLAKKGLGRIFAAGLIFLLLLAILALIRVNQTNLGTIVIGSKNFTEQVILGEILAQQIERKTNLKVERKFNLGGTFICHEAVKAGEIDGYVEYTGTALTAILQQPPENNPHLVYQKVKQFYHQNYQLAVLPSLGFNNTFAIVIRGEDAQKYNLKTISDVASYTPNWRAGFGYEFLTRADGYRGLAKTYNLEFAQPPLEMDLGLLYQALVSQEVDLVAGSATDGLIPVLNLVILADDLQYFPPYEAVPIFNQQTLINYPQLTKVIEELSGMINEVTMQRLNYLVDSQAQSPAEVVENWFNSAHQSTN